MTRLTFPWRRDPYAVLRRLPDDQWRELVVSGAEQYAGVRLPAVPPVEIQRRFNTWQGRQNLEAGFAYYEIIRAAAARHGRPLSPASQVLEFGCGWGRVLRCFLHDVPMNNLAGIDVSLRGIESCRSTLKGARVAINERWPPTNFAAGSFDLVYAVSVFSHLPETLHLAWLDEIRRILVPGGIFVGSTQGREMFKSSPESVAAYDAGELAFVPEPQPEYGQAAIPEAYIHKVWPAHLEVLEIIPRGAQGQVVIVTRAPQ